MTLDMKTRNSQDTYIYDEQVVGMSKIYKCVHTILDY